MAVASQQVRMKPLSDPFAMQGTWLTLREGERESEGGRLASGWRERDVHLDNVVRRSDDVVT